MFWSRRKEREKNGRIANPGLARPQLGATLTT